VANTITWRTGGDLLLLALAPLGGGVAVALFGVFLMVFWIWSLVNAIQNKGLTDGKKRAGSWPRLFPFHRFGALFFHRAAEAENGDDSDVKVNSHEPIEAIIEATTGGGGDESAGCARLISRTNCRSSR